MGTPSLTLNDVIPPTLTLPPSPPPSWSIFLGGKWDSVVWSAIFNILPVFSFSKNLISVSLHVISLSISNQRTKYRQLSIFPFPKMPSFSSNLINFWLSQLEVVFCSTFWRLQPGWAHLPPIWPKTDSVAGRQPPEGVHFLWIWRIDIAPSIPSQWLHFKIAKGWSSLFQVNGSDSDSRRQNPAQRIISDPSHNLAWKRDWKTILCNLCNIKVWRQADE